jgi:tRNA A-37 threonylcarbamoyl transferase component Bud32
VIGYLFEKVEGRHATSISDLPLYRTVLAKLHASTGCVHRDANRNNFIIRGSAALIFDFERAEEESEEMQEELETLEQMMKEDEETKLKTGNEGWKEQILREEVEVMAPLTEEEEMRRDEVGEDDWIEERIKRLLQ